MTRIESHCAYHTEPELEDAIGTRRFGWHRRTPWPRSNVAKDFGGTAGLARVWGWVGWNGRQPLADKVDMNKVKVLLGAKPAARVQRIEPVIATQAAWSGACIRCVL